MQSDGEEIRQQFIFSGLYSMLFEQFKKIVISTLEEFFSESWEFREGSIMYKRGSEFKEIIKTTGESKAAQHKNAAFRAGLHWFYNMDALTKDELNEFEIMATTDSQSLYYSYFL